MSPSKFASLTRVPLSLSLLSPFAAGQDPLAFVNGDTPDDSLGAAVASVGDLDGDGWSEIAVGSPGKESSSTQLPGSVQLHSGSDFALLGTASGDLGGTQFGAAVIGTPDLNGDGVPDLIVGAPDQAGKVRALDGALLAAGTAQALWTRDGEGSGQLGRSLASIDDLDGDGVADVACGEPFYGVLAPEVGPGRVVLLSGADGSDLGTIDGPDDNLASFGWSLTTTQDFDDDGLRDLAVGAPTADGNAPFSGAVFFVSTGRRDIVSMVAGDREDAQLGYALATGPDVDGWGTVFAGEPADTVTPAVHGRVLWLVPGSRSALLTLEGQVAGGGFGRSLTTGAEGRLLAIGEPSAAAPEMGHVYLADLETRRRRVALSGPAQASGFGAATAWIPTPEADAAGGLLIGAPAFDVTLGGDEGRVEVFDVVDVFQAD